MVHIRSRIALFVLALGAISLVASCATTQKAPQPAPEQPPVQTSEPDEKLEPEPQPADAEIYFTHTVKWTGESLSIIAAWYTGELENWKLLASANPELNPNLIRIGDEIRIPESLMVTTEILPFEFVAKYVPSLKRGRTASPASAPAESQPSVSVHEDTGEIAPAATGPATEADEASRPADEAGKVGMDKAGQGDSGGTGAEEKPKDDEEPVLFGPKSFD